MRDQTVADLDDLMGTVPAQPGDAIVAHREAHPGAPAEALLIAGQWLDHHDAVDAGDGAQLLADDGRLEGPLGSQAGVLPVAATAAAGAGMRAGWLDSVGCGGQDFHRVSPGELRSGLGDPDAHLLAGPRVPHEDPPPARGSRAGDAPAAVRGFAHREF